MIGVLAVLKAKRLYGTLPQTKSRYDKAMAVLENKESTAKLIPQARLIDMGRACEEAKAPDKALAVYKQVVSTYPDTLAAKLSQVRIRQLEAKTVARRPTGAGA